MTIPLPIGSARSQCGGCEKVFRSVNAFSAHRKDGKCLSDAALRKKGYEPNEQGIWRKPRPMDEVEGEQE